MRLARVVGQVVSTVKDPGLEGFKLLLVHDLEPGSPGSAAGAVPYVVVDLAGAGEDEVVLVATGGAARIGARTARSPVDGAVVGIVDSVTLGGVTTFRKT